MAGQIHMGSAYTTKRPNTFPRRLLIGLRARRQILHAPGLSICRLARSPMSNRSEEHTSELQSRLHLVCRLLLEKKNKHTLTIIIALSDQPPYFVIDLDDTSFAIVAVPLYVASPEDLHFLLTDHHLPTINHATHQ